MSSEDESREVIVTQGLVTKSRLTLSTARLSPRAGRDKGREGGAGSGALTSCLPAGAGLGWAPREKGADSLTSKST